MDKIPTPVFLGFPCGSAGKESLCNVGDLGLIPGLRRSPGEGNRYPLQYSGLENSIDSIVHGVAKSWTQLSGFHFLQFRENLLTSRAAKTNSGYFSNLLSQVFSTVFETVQFLKQFLKLNNWILLISVLCFVIFSSGES